MEHSSLTSQTPAVFKSINSRRILLAGGSKESHPDQLSDVRALDPRLREDDGQGSWHSLALVNARRVIKALNRYINSNLVC